MNLITHITGIIYNLYLKFNWLLISLVLYITYISSLTDYSYLRYYLLQIAQVELITCIPGIIYYIYLKCNRLLISQALYITYTLRVTDCSYKR